MFIMRLYYHIKPLIPRACQIAFRRHITLRKRSKYSHIWPIDPSAGKQPEGWSGWPDQKQFALVLQHDIDTQKGHDKCHELLALEESLGFRSLISFVPERYNVSESLRNDLLNKGFDIGVHGLKHDGKLFLSKKIFQKRASRINNYLRKWHSVGFSSPSMHHNLDWMHLLTIKYSISTFDTDPFEPQPDGVRTIFPFWVQRSSKTNGYVELPYTLPQDHTLFIIMREKTIDIWKQKLDWIAEKGGMVLLNSHPDYMNFCGRKLSIEEYPVKYYEDFLEYIKSKYAGQYWHVLPKDIAHFWKENVVQKSESGSPAE
jgi:hypothetical protein